MNIHINKMVVLVGMDNVTAWIDYIQSENIVPRCVTKTFPLTTPFVKILTSLELDFRSWTPTPYQPLR